MKRGGLGNGYKGSASTHRQMTSISVGFSHHHAASLKPVHLAIHNHSYRSNGWAGLR